MEPRARASRHKSTLNFGNELQTLLYAAGAPTHPDLARPQPDNPTSSAAYLATLPTPNKDHTPTPFSQPYPETVRVLDEILTDFIIETCHNAVAIASFSGRTKLKLSDFEYVVRNDSTKLGRVHELFRKDRAIKEAKKVMGEKGGTGRLGMEDLIAMGNVVGEEGTGKGKGRGRGRRKKRGIEDVNDAEQPGAGGAETNGVHDATLLDIDVEEDDLMDDEHERKTKKARSAFG